MSNSLEDFYLNKEEPNQSCFLALRNIILGMNNKMNETRKYGMPCFCYGKKAICYLWKDKVTNEPYILFVDGKLIEHSSLESGDRARMKIFSINPHQDLPINEITLILKMAIELHSNK